MASPSDGPLKRLIREIHRRSIWQVLGVYLLASWAVLGGVGTLMDTLNLPEWFPPLALAEGDTVVKGEHRRRECQRRPIYSWRSGTIT